MGLLGKIDEDGMSVDVKVNWTMGEWRRFFGLADVTPLVELVSLMSDRFSLLMIHQRLDAMEPDAKASREALVTTKGAEDRRSDQPTKKGPSDVS